MRQRRVDRRACRRWRREQAAGEPRAPSGGRSNAQPSPPTHPPTPTCREQRVIPLPAATPQNLLHFIARQRALQLLATQQLRLQPGRRGVRGANAACMQQDRQSVQACCVDAQHSTRQHGSPMAALPPPQICLPASRTLISPPALLSRPATCASMLQLPLRPPQACPPDSPTLISPPALRNWPACPPPLLQHMPLPPAGCARRSRWR